MSALATFFATAGAKGMADLDASAELDVDAVLGSGGVGAKLKDSAGDDKFPDDNAMAQAFVGMVDPNDAALPAPLPTMPHEDDPLCNNT
jgi:hypothetical protein